jgi:MFS family permease
MGIDDSRIGEWVLGDEGDIIGDSSLQLLLGATFFTILGTSMLSPILENLEGPLGVSSTQIGLLITAYTAPPILLIPLGGALADRVGRRPVLIVGLLLFGIAGSAIALTTNFHLVLGLRALQGAGYAFTLPVAITAVRDLYSGPAENTGQGLRLAVGGVGQIFVPLVASVLVVIDWRFPFLLFGGSVFVAVAFAAWFEEPLSRERQTFEDNTRGVPVRNVIGYGKRMFLLTRHPRVAAILACRGLLTFGSFSFLTYNSLIIGNVLDGGPEVAGLMVSIWAVAYTFTATQAGRISSRFGNQTVPLGATVLLIGTGLVILAGAPTVPIAASGALVIGIGIGIGFSLIRSLISGFAPEQLRGGLVGLGESLGRLAGSLTPVVLGLAIGTLSPDVGEDVALQIVVGGAGIGIIVVGLTLVGFAHVVRPVQIGTEPVS